MLKKWVFFLFLLGASSVSAQLLSNEEVTKSELKIPDSKALAMPDNLGSLKYNSSMDGNQIQILYTFEINQAIIEPEYYEILKNFYKEVINKQTEKIVLKKV